jgi:fructose-1,6-bisphosphatase/inositol monophosphatase family enzyme
VTPAREQGLPASTSGKPALQVARECAAEARDILRGGFGRTGIAGVKGRGNVVTEVDFAVERATIRRLEAEFPEHAVLSEETRAESRSEGWMWIIDPLDGTKNFSRGIPHFCFTLALCFAGEPLLGLTLQPILDEEYLAIAGGGTTLNGTPVTVSATQTVLDSVVAIDLGYDDRRGSLQLDLARHLFPGVQALRIPGSAAMGLAYVAAGRWDAFVHSALQPWDVAAGLLLIREAGGVVYDRDGKPASIFSEGVVAANPAVYQDFRRLAGSLPWRE